MCYLPTFNTVEYIWQPLWAAGCGLWTQNLMLSLSGRDAGFDCDGILYNYLSFSH